MSYFNGGDAIILPEPYRTKINYKDKIVEVEFRVCLSKARLASMACKAHRNKSKRSFGGATLVEVFEVN